MKNNYLFFLSAIFSFYVVAQPSISIEPFRTGFNKPVSIKHANDDRLFVVGQDGLIQILNADGNVNNTPFLNIESKVSNGGERGLLGLAFHPNYINNGFFYVNYTNNTGNTVVSRFSVNSTNSNLADPNSELILLIISQPFSNHNGGDLAFGSDGFLYISSGDGGSGGDPGDRAQSLNTLLGKILRIDVDNTSNGNNYAIPFDNPFIANQNALNEIWAYGLRNPWKFSFDRETNDLWIADVGQGEFEEINMTSSIATTGLNYGWRCYEGNSVFNDNGCSTNTIFTFPVAQYSHSNGRCSITGGYRYRGSENPNLIGLYFFADFCSNEIGILENDGSNVNITYTDQFTGNGWSTFGEDKKGELYIAGVISGTIYKIKDTISSVNNNTVFSPKMFPNPTSNIVKFDIDITRSLQQINFYNTQGRRIKSIKEFLNNDYNVSLGNLAKGLYFVEIFDLNGAKALKKLIIN